MVKKFARVSIGRFHQLLCVVLLVSYVFVNVLERTFRDVCAVRLTRKRNLILL